MAERLSTALRSFPSTQHVDSVCRPGAGEATCRYLVMAPNGFECAKGSSLRRTLDERFKAGTMRARGDNCEGVLGVIQEHQSELVGSKVSYRESMPSVELSGTFKGLSVVNGFLHIDVDWKGSEEFSPSLSVEGTEVNITDGDITFRLAGLGSFGGETTIHLNGEEQKKPERISAPSRQEQPKESTVIKLPKDDKRVAQLRAKLREYQDRIVESNRPPRSQQSAMHKAGVLERVLRDGKISTTDLRAEMASRLGGNFDISLFDNACGVIEDYCETGGARNFGGTGLPEVS